MKKLLAVWFRLACLMSCIGYTGPAEAAKEWSATWQGESGMMGQMQATITNPQAGLVVKTGQQITCTVTAFDEDRWIECNAQPPNGTDDDSLTYEWSATSGSFDKTNEASVTWTAPGSSPGPSAFNVTITVKVNDEPKPLGQGETGSRDDEGTAGITRQVKITVKTLDLITPAANDPRYLVGPGECDIVVKANVGGYDSEKDIVKFYRDGQEKGTLSFVTTVGNISVLRTVWNTDNEPRGDVTIIVKLFHDGNEFLSDSEQPVRLRTPRFPLADDEQDTGDRVRGLHGSGSWAGVDLDITGTVCNGTATVHASEEGTATPGTQTPDCSTPPYCPCSTVNYYVNLSLGTYRVRLTNVSGPQYEEHSLVVANWHMEEQGRVSGNVGFLAGLGNGWGSGHVSGTHDHFIFRSDGTGIDSNPPAQTDTSVAIHASF